MRIGIWLGGLLETLSIDEIVAQARDAADAGFASAWMPQLFSWDALTVLAVVGREVPGIELGTAVVPTYPRHPMMLASQALTVQAAIGNRLSLGIGTSHQAISEGMFGYPFEKPARHMREYLSILAPLLRGERASFQGETLKAEGTVDVPGAAPPSLLVAALGPVMLRLAGELSDGTITAWTGPVTLAQHIVPTITQAAAAAGRADPRVVAVVLVSVTADADAARAWIGERFGMAGQAPSYRAMLEREGAAGPEDVVVAGDETSVERALRRYAEAGATELVAIPFGSAEEQTRTFALLAARSRESEDRRQESGVVSRQPIAHSS
jgi:F420-dependent oxidoreductase-like protein